MQNLSLFGEPQPSLKRRLAGKLAQLAAEGVYIGTSSWKYEGWLGQVYTPERYRVNGRFSRRKFEQECLAEYAETFPAVCGDFSFYQFPAPDHWARLFTAASRELQFGFKVPEEITVKWWPQHARYGDRAGAENRSFLQPEVLEAMLLEPLGRWRRQVAVLIFEFGAFDRRSYARGEEFVHDLDRFLGRIPKGWRWAVEIRNPELLARDYLECLRAHSVAHVFNAWRKMPELAAQASLPGAFTTDFFVARALLKAGRGYQEAVDLFAPYTRVHEVNAGARESLRAMVDRARQRRQNAFLFVNNRLEGNAPETIAAVVDQD